MQVTINTGANYSVTIQGGFTGPYINLEISPALAYALLLALDAKREELRDLAVNYYDCKDCGNTHHKSIKTCPHVGERGVQP